MPEKRFVPLVEVTRGGRVESYHWAALVVSDADGRILAAVGDQQATVFSRSAAKPFQACTLVRSGAAEAFSVNDRELAVACSSHGGEPFHLQAVESLLRKGGFSSDDLRCGLHEPWHPPVARELMQAERPPTTLHNNCSGKHAAMLALARHLGGDPREYLDPEGPAQKAILGCLAEHTGLAEHEIHRALDGCSAPTFALPLASLARGYARLARCLVEPGFHPALAAVARAMAKHPDLVAGTGRLETALMKARPGALIAKVGVEGIYAVAGIGPDGPVGLALKVADGDAERARGPLAIEALVRIGVLDRDAASGLLKAFPRVLRTLAGQEVGTVQVNLPEDIAPGAK
jgi:L-asparaginase II